jgi:hypothetical protein
MARPGVVHASDLLHRYMWQQRQIAPFLAAAGLDVASEPSHRAFAPPRVLIVIAHHDDVDALPRLRHWLNDAAHVVVVRGPPRVELPEIELYDEDWAAVPSTLPRAEVIHWDDLNDAAPCRAAIDRALALADSLDDEPAPPPQPPDLELPASAWSTGTCEFTHHLAARVAAKLRLHDDRALLIAPDGVPIDLAAPLARIPLTYPYEGVEHAPRCWPVGVDPVHQVAWQGHRMAISWSYLAAGGASFLSATDHDWPCGPAKKLWGYDDNDPVAVALSPAADACVQTFAHDALVTEEVPVRWHRAGTVDVAAFARDPYRALLYAQTAEFVETRASEDLAEDDNRELAPVVVLGPDRRARYAVDLRHRVVRLTGHEESLAARVVGGPDEGYVVCDADHGVVRRGTGTLLGGWYRHATIEDAGWLWREDLATGERRLLEAATRVRCLDPEVEAIVQDAIREGRHDDAARIRSAHGTRAIPGEVMALAIPGTRNILELAIGEARWAPPGEGRSPLIDRDNDRKVVHLRVV